MLEIPPSQRLNSASAGIIYGLLGALTIPCFLAAAEPGLDTTVITAMRRESDLLDSPVALSIIGREDIERRPAATIADLMRHQPGVMIADNSIPGLQRFRIRGEEARRSLVLIDGQPVSDHSTFGSPLFIDPSFIHRIELVRGPHSTLYGSQAAGGVVNIITHSEPIDGFEGSIGAAYDTGNRGYRANLAAAVGNGAWYFKAATGYSRNHDRRTPGGRLDDTSSEWDSHMLQIGWANDRHAFRFSYDRHNLSSEAHTARGQVDGFILSRFQLDLPARDREKFAVFYEGKDLLPGLNKLRVDAYRQSVDRNLTLDIAGVIPPPFPPPPTIYSYFNDDFDTIDTTGVNLQTDWSLGTCHTLIAGVSYTNDDLDKSVTRTGFTRKGPVFTPVNTTIKTRAELETLALFIQDTWKPNDRWQINAGLRNYNAKSRLKKTNDPSLAIGSDHDSHTIGSLSLVYKPTDQLALRASWAQGYVYPTLLHLHTGSLFGQGNLTHPNPDLDPETSNNFEIGLRYQSDGFTADFAVFHNRAKDYITTVPSVAFPGDNTYANLEAATTTGVELGLTAGLYDSGATAYINATWMRRKVDFSTFSTSDSGLPRINGRAGVRYESATPKGTRWYIDGYLAASSSTTKRTTRTTTSTDSWATLNLSAGTYIKDAWIGVEALNLTNTSYQPSADELAQPGIHFTFGCRHRF